MSTEPISDERADAWKEQAQWWERGWLEEHARAEKAERERDKAVEALRGLLNPGSSNPVHRANLRDVAERRARAILTELETP